MAGESEIGELTGRVGEQHEVLDALVVGDHRRDLHGRHARAYIRTDPERAATRAIGDLMGDRVERVRETRARGWPVRVEGAFPLVGERFAGTERVLHEHRKALPGFARHRACKRWPLCELGRAEHRFRLGHQVLATDVDERRDVAKAEGDCLLMTDAADLGTRRAIVHLAFGDDRGQALWADEAESHAGAQPQIEKKPAACP